MRQIPYTMMKFACFERTVEALYKYVVPKPRAECSKSEQLIVTFSAGYIAGVFCAIVSHPADTVVSKLNNDVGSTALGAARELGMKGELNTSFFTTFVFMSTYGFKNIFELLYFVFSRVLYNYKLTIEIEYKLFIFGFLFCLYLFMGILINVMRIRSQYFGKYNAF